MRYVTVPGIDGSDQNHWQTLWERDLPADRFSPNSWDVPDAGEWLGALHRELTGPTIVVAHSLGCLTTAAAMIDRREIVGALLVAVPDPSGPNFPGVANGFEIAHGRLHVPATVVASSNDPYCSLEFAQHMAERWGATFVDAGACGHLNSDSGLGAWPVGRVILDQLVAATSAG